MQSMILRYSITNTLKSNRGSNLNTKLLDHERRVRINIFITSFNGCLSEHQKLHTVIEVTHYIIIQRRTFSCCDLRTSGLSMTVAMGAGNA